MDEKQVQVVPGPTVTQRRNMLAVVGAVVAGLFARSAKPAQAATGSPLVLGQNNSASNTTRLDVFGNQALLVSADTGQGIFSFCGAANGFGVQGVAPNGYGITGVTHAAQFASLLGFADTAGSAALQGTATIPNATAGAFFGPVALNGDVSVNPYQGGAGSFGGNLTVTGNLTVSGTKSAAVRASDGAHHLLYCVESTESWFEDFGEATLENGTARVVVEPLFAEVTHIQSYHIFLTPYGDTQGLHVTSRTATGFVVRENRGGKSSVAFSYRIVAKRKDVPAARLPKIQLTAPTYIPAHLDMPASSQAFSQHP